MPSFPTSNYGQQSPGLDSHLVIMDNRDQPSLPLIWGSLFKLPSSCPPAWGTQGLFCAAVPISGRSGRSGRSARSAAEFQEPCFWTTLQWFWHISSENDASFPLGAPECPKWAMGYPDASELEDFLHKKVIFWQIMTFLENNVFYWIWKAIVWKKNYLDASELEGNRVEKKFTWMPQRWRAFL